MEIQLVEKPQMILVGLVESASDVSQLDIRGMWERFNQHSESIKGKIEGKFYEVHIQAGPAARHFCLIGVEVADFDALPAELFVKPIPAFKYAMFTHCLKDGNFGSAFTQVYDWLRKSDYVAAYPYDIQCYDNRFKGPGDPASVFEIYLPVIPRKEPQPG